MFVSRIVKAGSDLAVCVVNLLNCYNCTSLKEITIPYYVESVGKNAFTFKDKNYNYLPLELEIINFGAKLKSIENLPINSNTLQEINVDAKNGFFSSEKGVLYNKNKSQLIKYPVAKDNNSNFAVKYCESILKIQ